MNLMVSDWQEAVQNIFEPPELPQPENSIADMLNSKRLLIDFDLVTKVVSCSL
jgi:hypothetical protein